MLNNAPEKKYDRILSLFEKYNVYKITFKKPNFNQVRFRLVGKGIFGYIMFIMTFERFSNCKEESKHRG